jgi:flavodoxin
MSKKLVAYFSASGVTKAVAEKITKSAEADIFEIVPALLYTKDDLNWRNSNSRSSVEMKNKEFRPEIAESDLDISGYDTIYLGFPIWWYVAPTIINTFLEKYDFKGKKIIVFATSGSSGMGNTLAELKPSAPDAVWGKAERLPSDISQEDVNKWVKE